MTHSQTTIEGREKKLLIFMDYLEHQVVMELLDHQARQGLMEEADNMAQMELKALVVLEATEDRKVIRES